MQEVFPLISKILEDDLDKLLDPQQLMAALPKLLKLLPQKKKKRGER